MNNVVAGGVPQGRGTVMVLGSVKHDVLSILLYHGRIKCSCRFEPLAAGRQDRVGGKPHPLSKKRSKWNGGSGGPINENQPCDGHWPSCPGCNNRDLDPSMNSLPYDR